MLVIAVSVNSKMTTRMDMVARVLFVLIAAVFSTGLAEDEVQTPAIEVSILNGTGFNISIPEAGKAMLDFRYYVSFNAELKDATELYCKGQVECFSPQSKFKLVKHREMKEGDVLHFYLIGYKKPENFQMERVYEVKKNDEGELEFQEKSSRASSEKEGYWYEHAKLDKLPEKDP